MSYCRVKQGNRTHQTRCADVCPTHERTSQVVCTATLATVAVASRSFYEHHGALRSPVVVLGVLEDDSVKGVRGPVNHGKYACRDDHLVQQAFRGAEGKAGALLKPVIAQGRQDKGQEGAAAAKKSWRARETGKRAGYRYSGNPVSTGSKCTRGRHPSKSLLSGTWLRRLLSSAGKGGTTQQHARHAVLITHGNSLQKNRCRTSTPSP